MFMTVIIVIFMVFMVFMIMIFMIVIVIFMIMIVIVIFMIVIFMIMIVIVILMIVIFMIMIVIVIMDMHFSVKVFSFSPNQSRPNGSFDRERAAICEAPLEDTAKDAIDGVVLGIPLKVGVKATMAFDGDDGREIEFTGLKRLSTTTMGAMGLGRRNRGEWAQQKSQKSKAQTEHEMR